LLGSDLQVRPRHGRIRLRDRWVAFPLRTGDLLRRLPPRFAAGAALDAVVAPGRKPRADTFAEVVRAGLGPTVARTFYEPYAHKLWDAGGSELAGELARRRVGTSSPAAVVRRFRHGPQTFLYPRTGYGAISEALAQAATEAGASIRLGTAVAGVDLAEPDHLAIDLADGSTLPATRVFSTIPLPVLARLARPAPPSDVVDAASRLRHRAMVLVYLVVDRPQWTEFDAHYFPGPEVPASRVSEPKNYRDNPDDPPERTVLCAEVPCWEGDSTWTAPDEALGERLARSLAACGLPDPQPVAVVSHRHPRVYPVYRIGFEWDLSALELWLGADPRLITLGRQGLFVPDNTHHALAMAWAAADTLRPDKSFDHEEWARARDGFRAHIVED
jgi:protoporphyrinogen oxidase